ncbi:hypothetical protein Y032_0049g1848 [Ancylostoma ceylanicum]|uniref:Uncharacterized protein n=1 Tax=Ancylostoma ceylanicum TaxID=53326 RepID=A0A016UAD6_9BILA|nr:hypothetical protein Y032_0049g1848 [Ancylostoma ceylanicum]
MILPRLLTCCGRAQYSVGFRDFLARPKVPDTTPRGFLFATTPTSSNMGKLIYRLWFDDVDTVAVAI